jgi:hypothetical protein
MTCHLCQAGIAAGDEVNLHHPTPRSQGGTRVEPTHRDCHVRFHSQSNHFREWGKIGGQISALSKQWAFNLRNVKDDPAYDYARQFNRAFYAH